MKNVKFYLAGGMTGLSDTEQFLWRMDVENTIRNIVSDYEIKAKPDFFNPPEYFSIDEPTHQSEYETMEFDLYNLKRSDVVIVNFNSPNSIGTAMELAVAYENRIPILAFNEDDVELHPWLKTCCNRVFTSVDEIANYACYYYLI